MPSMVKKEKESQVYKPNVGDRIICESKGFKYEAKIQNERKDPNSNEKNPVFQYFVHYQGWNKSWDEWVGLDRIFEWNSVNIALMKEQASKPRSGKGTGSARKKLAVQQNQSNTSTISTQGSASESIIVETEEPIQLTKEIKIKVPEELKNWLIDDDNNIKNKKQLTILPARITISTILKDFVAHKKISTKTSPTDKEVILNELTLGIKDYFNVMLGSFLLYKFERLQYQNLLKEHGKDVDLTAQYGVIHLIRLFTRIGRPLAATTLDPQNVQTIVNYIQDLLKFISKQTNLFDLDKNYNIAPPDYIKNALK